MNISLGTATDNLIAETAATQASNKRAISSRQDHGEAAIVSLGSSVDDLQTKLDGMPETGSDRIQALRSSIRQGTYSVDPAQVANAMFTQLFGEK